jgi:hypothetical protein
VVNALVEARLIEFNETKVAECDIEVVLPVQLKGNVTAHSDAVFFEALGSDHGKALGSIGKHWGRTTVRDWTGGR